MGDEEKQAVIAAMESGSLAQGPDRINFDAKRSDGGFGSVLEGGLELNDRAAAPESLSSN